jgi:stage IV sporulation protein A
MDNSVYDDLYERCKCVGVVALDDGAKAFAEKLSTFCSDKKINLKVVDSGSFSVDLCEAYILLLGDSSGDISGVTPIIECEKPTCAVTFGGGENLQNSGLKVINLSDDSLDEATALNIFKTLLFDFPLLSFDVVIPDWMRFLTFDSKAIDEILVRVKNKAVAVKKMSDCNLFDDMLAESSYWLENVSVNLDLGKGYAKITAFAREGILFEMLSDIVGEKIGGEYDIMRYVASTQDAKQNYDKIKDAFECAKINGYGIVQPQDSDLSLEEPKIVKSGGNVGIKLKASAPSYHIVKVDVSGEVSPIMGNAGQSEGIVQGMMSGFEKDPEGMWDTNMFGKSLKGMVRDGLWGKVASMQNDTKGKMRKAITRIVNEGKGGVICILL